MLRFLTSAVWGPPSLAPTTVAADTVTDVIGVPLAFSGTVIAHIQYGGREKMILTMPLAVPLATGPTHTHTYAHTSAHYLCFAFLRGVEKQAHVSPWITFKKRQWEWFYSCRRKTQSILISYDNTLTCCVSLIVFISLFDSLLFIPIFSSVSDQVVGPPSAGAFRERPYKTTMFRRSYERGELPVALEHGAKGNSIAWKVGVLPFDGDWIMLMCFTRYWHKG